MNGFLETALPRGRCNLSRQSGGIVWHIVLSILVCCLTACGAQQQLSNTSASMDEIVKRVLDNLQKNDLQALESMRITEQEFRTLIFPGLPIGKIKQWQDQYDFVWGDVNTKSNYGLHGILAAYGGKKFSFVRLKFKKGETRYELENKLLFSGKSYTLPFGSKSYTGHEEAIVIVKDESGEEKELKLFGGIIEHQGHYKIMSFNIGG